MIGKAIGLSLSTDPEAVSMPSRGFQAAVGFWNSKGLNAGCVKGTDEEFKRLTLSLTGGYSGLAERQTRFAFNRQGLGC